MNANNRTRVGTAPVSYGIYGSAVDGLGAAVDPDHLLAAMAKGGYLGSELGPPRLFGSPEALAERFTRAGLEVVGGYIPLHLGDASLLDADLEMMNATLDELSVVEHGKALAIFADVGTTELMANPARPWDDRRLALDNQGWASLAEGIRHATELAQQRCVATSFHPHISTYVESPWEVERLLELTDIDLTLDVGHLFLAGGDPVECFDAWRDRINHIHLKDVRAAVMYDAKARGATDFDGWWDTISCPLGSGDVDLDRFCERIRSSGYEGWLVIEQDRPPTGIDDYAAVAAEQAANGAWLRSRLS